MFIGRKEELITLQKNYENEESNLIILYGREGIGKTSLIKEFIKDKPYIYYQAREYSKKEQNFYLEKKLDELGVKILGARDEKICFILDEFDLISKGYKDFYEEIGQYISKLPKGKVCTIFVSSSIQWVENSMVDDMGVLSRDITSFIKLKEFTFMDIVDLFPSNSNEECMYIYAVFGGVPAYLSQWNPKENVKKNIIRILLSKNGSMHKEISRYLKTFLRELPFYNTILAVLAEDEPKLNYMYKRTDFSRAKISVYIKNLIQMDVAQKLYSFEAKDKDNVQKGLYGISDSLVYFWYKLIYPNLTELSLMDESDFYNKYVKSGLEEILEKTYEKVCKEFLELMSRFNHLPEKFGKFESFYGKMGYIPIVSESENGKILVALCKWNKKQMNVREFESLLRDTGQIGKDADYYYLFSKEGFAPELEKMAEGMKNITCISLEDF